MPVNLTTIGPPGPDIQKVITHGAYYFTYCMDSRTGDAITYVMYACGECGVPLFLFPLVPNGDVQLVAHSNWHYNQEQP